MAKKERELPHSEDSCLTEAQLLVYGNRNRSYGHPYDDYKRTVAIFNAMTGRDLTPAEGADFMLAVKLSRMQHGEKRDNYVDLAGYTEVRRIIVEAEEHESRFQRGTSPTVNQRGETSQ